MAPQPPRVNAFKQAESLTTFPPNRAGIPLGQYYGLPGRSDGPPRISLDLDPPYATPSATPTPPQLSGKPIAQYNEPSKLSSARPKPVPPTTLVEPFGQGINASTIPLTPGLPGNDVNKPTCSLNLVCYRSGDCISRQIQVASRKRTNRHTYASILKSHPELITSDHKLFKEMRRIYLSEMCGFWRRYFSLKTLRRLQLLSYTMDSRPVPVPLDEFTMQEVLWAFNHPESFSEEESQWVEWVFRLRQKDKRHALQFVEDWNGMRIAIVGAIPCVLSTAVGIIWCARGGDIQTAFTVAGFILTVATVLLALLAVISGIDSSRRL